MYFFAPCPLVCQETFLKCNYGIYQYLAASGQNGHIENVPWGGGGGGTRYTLPLQWLAGEKVCVHFRGVLSLCPLFSPPSWESCRWLFSMWPPTVAATWVSVRQTQLCFNICNMYSNTPLCIYIMTRMFNILHKCLVWFSFFLNLEIAIFLNRIISFLHCCVVSSLA